MKHGRRSLFFTVLFAVPALVLACGDGGDSGTDVRVPSTMQKTAGDDQTGPPGTTLPDKLEVKVSDDQGRSVPDFTVSFSTTGGTVNPQSMDTDADGRARTSLTLPSAGETVTVTASGAGVPSVTFTAEAVPEQLGFQTSVIPAGRSGVSYVRSLEATGGVGSGYTFEITSGGLPSGMTLASDGTFSGTPSQEGSFTFTVQLTDGEGTSTSRPFELNVCEQPVPMAVGDVRVSSPSEFGECGVWIPNDVSDQYYRVAVVRTNREEGGFLMEREVTATVSGFGVTASQVAGTPGASPAWSPLRSDTDRPPLDGRVVAQLRELAEQREATARYHHRLLADADDLVRRLGPDALVRPADGPAAVAGASLPDKVGFRVTTGSQSTCGDFEEVRAVKIEENDHLAIYQDSTQNASANTRVTSGQAQLLLDYYRDYGKPVIDTYFDGVNDIDNNGKVIIFVTPEAADNVLGFVWPGDMFDRDQCAASNEAELVYMGADQILALTDPQAAFGLGLATVVHEVKHVSSLFERLQGSSQETHPLWYEEGSAEIAATQAARLAWADAGGPAVTERIVEDDWRAQTSGEVTNENVVLVLQLLRLQASLAEQPNAIIQNTGNSDDVYGSGWLFLRWLGDSYGDAGSGKFAEAPLFRAMNDRNSPEGVDAVEAATGASWETLMEEFTAAIMYNGTPAMESGDDGPRPITGWDFVGALELWCFAVDPFQFDDTSCSDNPGAQPGAPGAFPWPVTVTDDGSQQFKRLVDGVYRGDAGQAGFRVHDFRTNGTGDGAEITLDVQPPARVVLIRII